MSLGLTPELKQMLAIFLGLIAASLVATVILGLFTYRRLRNLRLPADADFAATLRGVPLSLVIILDLLDFALDIFAAPVAWVLLGRLGLKGLRGVTVVEDLIPGTQLIPLMTTAWLLVRLYDRWQPR